MGVRRHAEGGEVLSLTSSTPDVTEMASEIVKHWDTIARRLDAASLASFTIHLAEILGKSGQTMGQMGQKSPHVTGQVDSVTTRIYDEKELFFGTGCHCPAVTEVSNAGT